MNQIIKLYNKGKYQLDVKGKFKQLVEDIPEENLVSAWEITSFTALIVQTLKGKRDNLSISLVTIFFQ